MDPDGEADTMTTYLSGGRVLATLTLSGLLLAAGWGAAPAAEAAPLGGPAVAAQAPAPGLPAWCPFGTHHGAGSGCRGGSVNDNERVNRAAKATWIDYRDATKCALGGVAGATRDSPKTGPKFAVDSLVGGFSCGVATYDQHAKDVDAALRGE